jgi:hypothetical protein
MRARSFNPVEPVRTEQDEMDEQGQDEEKDGQADKGPPWIKN